ncbi:MAG: ParB/RepB/Spo0J family partition protein [Candidatus Susulua stagnicola]|nr:ParB/RepB/Spo0J family partition protein [Candidatus Susulua stagnicola]
MDRKVLGRGLDALIPKKTAAMLPREFIRLSLDKVKPAKCQPRQEISEKELGELTRSIKEKGFIQPIVAREISGGSYEIVAGERRYEAAKSLGLKEIPTIIKELDDKEAFVLAIVENLQRQDLNPIEEAEAFKRLIEDFDFSLEDVAKFVGKDKTTVVNVLRLLKLPEKIKEAVRKRMITRTQARTILGADKIQTQEKIFYQILKEGMSVREIENKVRMVSKKKKKSDPFIVELEERLQKLLGTKVKVFNKKKNRGRIVVEYYSLEDLERIIKKLK